MRLQKYLAMCGVASRRKAEILIDEGRVKVDGLVVERQGVRVNEDSVVELDGKIVKAQNRRIYIMLNKPVGYVTTSKDQFNRPIVLDLLKGLEERVFPVGRLDYDTEGLLLLTNDGDLTNFLTHPRNNVVKTYQVWANGVYDDGIKDVFKKGIIIDGRRTRPCKISLLRQKKHSFLCEVKMSEGRNRQVRRLMEAASRKVISLRRVSIGQIQLGDLEVGAWRMLTRMELKCLKDLRE